MRADWREQYGRNVRVYERAACGERVRCAACRGAEDDSVGRNARKQAVVGVEVEAGNVRTGTAVNDEFVEDFMGFAFDLG